MSQSVLSRVLHVDDEPDIREVAKLALEHVGGYTVMSCASGAAAIAQAPAFRPDIILIDVMMPEMDGPTALRSLRTLEATAKTPVAFMTAKVQQHEVEHLKALGAAGVIQKPFDPMALSERVREIWENAQR